MLFALFFSLALMETLLQSADWALWTLPFYFLSNAFLRIQLDPPDQLPPPKYEVEAIGEADPVGTSPFVTRLAAAKGETPNGKAPFPASVRENRLLTVR